MQSLAWIWVWLAILTTTLSEFQALDSSCLSSCDSEHVCRCASKKLNKVPSGLPREVQELDLSSNNIEHIKYTDLKEYLQIKTLFLQFNVIDAVDKDTFLSSKTIEHLDLSFNNLTTLEFSWFKPLVSLKILNLLGNYYTTLGANPLFVHLPLLKKLQVGNSDFVTIEKHNFEGIRNLEALELDALNLYNYQSGSFSTINKIVHLTVNVKKVLLFSVLGDLIHSVTWLEVRNADFKSPESVAGMDMLIPSLVQKLTLRNASLTDMSALKFFLILKNCKNVIELGVEESIFKGTLNVPPFDYIGPVPVRVLTFKNIESPYFFIFSDFSDMYHLIVNMTSVTCVNSTAFLMTCPISRAFKSLQYLDLSGNLFKDETWKFSTCYVEGGGAWPLLRTLNMSGNLLQNLNMVAESLSKHEHLANIDISNNNFATQMPNVCNWTKALTYLNISSCQITVLTSCIPTTLEILDVSNNVLTEFTVELPQLKELYIRKNRLLKLPDSLYLPYLKTLMISTNLLTGFSKEILESFKNLTSVDATNNSYDCSCQLLSFIQKDNVASNMLIGRPANYVCATPFSLNNVQVKNAWHPLIVCHPALIVSLICCVVLLVVILSTILCYKYHAFWYAKMIWAWLMAKRKPRVERHNTCYDAFISYCERDSEWVENIMAHELEKAHPPLRLCLHRRDFAPGKWIIDNIIDCMEKSYKTVFVLSEYFVQSEWCKYELELSHFRQFDENNDSIILVLLEPIERESIPKRFSKLRKVLNTKTYLEWPIEEDQQEIFWCKLRTTLDTEKIL